jgi:hypothetical protein
MIIQRIEGIDGNIRYGADWDGEAHGMACWAKDERNDVIEFVEFPNDSGSIGAFVTQIENTLDNLILYIRRLQENE